MIRLDFGKYKGCKLSEVPENYLIWLSDNEDSSPTWRALAQRQLGLPDQDPDANDDTLKVAEPDERPAAKVLPLLIFRWVQKMEADFRGDPAALAVVGAGLKVLRELGTAVTGRRLPTEAELAEARAELDGEAGAEGRV